MTYQGKIKADSAQLERLREAGKMMEEKAQRVAEESKKQSQEQIDMVCVYITRT